MLVNGSTLEDCSCVVSHSEAIVENLCYQTEISTACINSLRQSIIGSDKGFSPDWCQAIIRTNAGILLIGN